MRILLVVCLFACGGKGGGGGGADADPNGDGQTSCVDDGDCGTNQKCTDGVCVGGCGSEELEIAYVPPNFIVSLDRSCSMRTNIPGTGTSKWKASVDALNNVLGQYASDIRWGLTLFPDTTGQTCQQDAIPIPIGDGNAPAISTLLSNALVTTDPLYPDGPCVTNIDTGVTQAATDPALTDTTRKNFVMLVTDGAQSNDCGGNAGDTRTEAAITDLFTDRGITTFVVGFGGEVDAVALDKFAVAGGAALPATPKYYQADTAAQLEQAFETISGLVVSCEFIVDPAPADLAQTYVYFNETEQVPRDTSHTMGWDYDPATLKLTLYGGHCDRLKARQVDDVDVIFGCPPVF
jgi:hypothetical protein